VGQSSSYEKLTIYFHSVPRFGMSGTLALLLHRPSWNSQGKLSFLPVPLSIKSQKIKFNLILKIQMIVLKFLGWCTVGYWCSSRKTAQTSWSLCLDLFLCMLDLLSEVLCLVLVSEWYWYFMCTDRPTCIFTDLLNWDLISKCIYNCVYFLQTSWLHRTSTILNPLLLPTDAHNVKKRRVIKTF